MAFYGEESWDYYAPAQQRRPSPHHYRSNYNDTFLSPGPGASGLHRSRSQGHAPAPQINVYNRMYNDQESRTASPYPPAVYPPYPPETTSRRASPRASPDRRGRGSSRLGDRLGDELVDELADMALEHRYRSRSRGRSDASAYDRSPIRVPGQYPAPGYAEWQLAQKEAEAKERSRERMMKLEHERMKNKMKIEAMEKEKEEELAKEREQRIVQDWERKRQEVADKKKADEKRAIEEFELKQKEAKDKAAAEELRIKEKMERDRKEAKEKEERAYREFKQKEKEAKDEEERKYNEFLRLQKEKEEKKKREEKEAEESFQSEMRKRLADLGYTEKTIEIMVDKEKAKKFKSEVERKPDSLNVWQSPRAPVYPKIHRDYLAVETLKYYGLQWEIDNKNPDYIIILRDMDKRETDMLFEHTSRLRAGRLMLDAPEKKKPEFAWVRRRSRSRSNAAKSVGILRIA